MKNFFICITLLLISCNQQQKPPGLTIPVPFDTGIWPDGKVTVQTQTSSMTALSLIANGEKDEIKEFYNDSFSDWQELSQWQNSKIPVNTSKGYWKSWEKDNQYAVIIIGWQLEDKTVVTHTFTKSEMIFKTLIE